MLLFLVRHAHAVPRGRWEGPDLDRPLDDKGRRQAAAVAAHIGERLDGDPPPLVVASPAVRCVDSVAPLAQHYGISVGTDARLLEIAEVDADSRPDPEDAVTWLADRLCDVVDDALAAGSGKGGVVICTHGQVLPPGIARIVDGVDLDAAVEHNDKGGFWVTVIEDGRCESAEYVGAP